MRLNECIEKMRQSIEDLDELAKEYAVGKLDPEIQGEIAQLFDDSMRQLLSNIDSYCAAGDYASVAGAAHQIKGMAGTVGYPEISAVAKVMEDAAKSNEGQRCVELLQLLCEWDAARCEQA